MSTLQLMRGLSPQGSGGGGGGGGGSPITRIPNVFVVLADGSGDYANLTTAINNIGSSGAKIILGTGTFSITGGIANPNKSNIVIEGQGPGNTIISFNNTSASSSLDFEGTTDATSATLNSDALAGTNTINIPSASAALLSVGQYVLIRSNKIADPDFTGRKVGEIQKISAISGSVVTFEDNFADTYDTAHGASSRGLQMIHDITLRNLTITSTAVSSSLGQGEIFFRFVRNVTIDNVECDSLWWAGIDFSSCINVRCKAYVHDTQDPSGASGSTHYGVVCHSATKDSTFHDSFFYKVRHGFTSGGQSGTNFEGVPRNVVVDHCVAQACDEAAFDCHNSGEGIIFVGCVSLGGLPAATNTQAGTFQIRAPKSAVKSCLAINNAGRGIYFLGSASGGQCTGNTVINTRAVSGGAAGDGIYLDPSITQILIDNNTVNGVSGRGVNATGGGNDDCVVTNNTFLACNPSDGDISFSNSNNVSCCHNQCRDGTGRGLVMAGTSDKWRILGNDWSNKPTTSPTLVGSSNIVFFNKQTAGQALTVTASPLTLSGFGSLTVQTDLASTKTEIDIVPNISTVASSRTGGQLKLYNSSDLTNFEFLQILTQGTGNYLIDIEKAGTGSLRQLDISMQGTVALSVLTGATINIASPLAIGTNLSLSATGLTAVRTFTFPDLTDTLVALTATQTLTNKTVDAASNTLSNVMESPLVKRTGLFVPTISSTGNGTGILQGVTGVGTGSSAFDSGEGTFVQQYLSAASANVNCGIISGASAQPIARRSIAMRFVARFAIDSTTSSRVYFGLTSAGTLPISDTPLASTDDGVLVGFRSTDTNWTTFRNDGSTGMSTTDLGVAKDAAFHTVEINWAANGNINIIFDGSSSVLSAVLPRTSISLFYNLTGQTTTTTQRTFKFRGAWVNET
jgi:hypothetical protein